MELLMDTYRYIINFHGIIDGLNICHRIVDVYTFYMILMDVYSSQILKLWIFIIFSIANLGSNFRRFSWCDFWIRFFSVSIWIVKNSWLNHPTFEGRVGHLDTYLYNPLFCLYLASFFASWLILNPAHFAELFSFPFALKECLYTVAHSHVFSIR